MYKFYHSDVCRYRLIYKHSPKE